MGDLMALPILALIGIASLIGIGTIWGLWQATTSAATGFFDLTTVIGKLALIGIGIFVSIIALNILKQDKEITLQEIGFVIFGILIILFGLGVQMQVFPFNILVVR